MGHTLSWWAVGDNTHCPSLFTGIHRLWQKLFHLETQISLMREQLLCTSPKKLKICLTDGYKSDTDITPMETLVQITNVPVYA